MYKVLYRKWRPRTFSQVVGQRQITDTLKNEVKTGRLSHAYLFVGSRGTGKTSCAKILAKAVNCLHPQDGDPCDQCEMCRGVNDGSLLDVVEIDAASNNGVDNIRELREEAGFTPASAKFRVYIIDEAHMLSKAAFNALLKTLEEPPAHVIFILATTEVNSLPSTILSRCQRFDFNRIPPETIAGRLMEVAAEEKIELTEPAALLIGRLADGALRDALSRLDSCAARGGVIDEAAVSLEAGLAGRDVLFDMTDYIKNGDVSGALTTVDRLYNASRSMRGLCEELIMHLRNLLLAKTSKEPQRFIIADSAEIERYKAQSQCFSAERLVAMLRRLSDCLDRIARSPSPRGELEIAVIGLAAGDGGSDTAALKARIKRLEEALAGKAPARISQAQSRGDTPPWDAPAKAGKAQSRGDTPPWDAPAKTNSAQSRGDTPPWETPAKASSAQSRGDTPPWETPAKASQAQSRGDTPPWETPAKASSAQSRGDTPPWEAPAKASSAQSRGDTPPLDAPAKAEQAGGVPTDFWQRVLDNLHTTNRAIYAVLNDSTACVKGEYVMIKAPNPLFATMVKDKRYGGAIVDAVAEVMGRRYRIGLYKTAPPPQKKDPLDDFLNSAQKSGIKIDIK